MEQKITSATTLNSREFTPQRNTHPLEVRILSPQPSSNLRESNSESEDQILSDLAEVIL